MSDSLPTGKTYWKSFEELSSDPEVMEQLKHEFPEGYDTPPDASSMKRRTFMGLMAASMALAATACRRPEQQIVPYVNKPEYMIPGIANHFTSTFSIGNFASGLLVKSREGRPVKIEGNDLDPISGGASSVLAQASLLALYDPDRVLRPTVNNADSTPLNALSRMAAGLREAAAKNKQVRIVIDEHASPAFASLCSDLERVLPNTKVVTWPAITNSAAAEANKQLLGIDAVMVPDLSKSDVILGIDADFLGSDPEALYHIKKFAMGRKPSLKNPEMNRYYAVESGLSTSGANADYRVRIKPTEFNEFLLALLHELVVVRKKGDLGNLASAFGGHQNTEFSFLKQIADDLTAGKGLVMVGRHLPTETHALSIMVNHVIGAYGADKPIDPSHVLPYSNTQTEAIEELQKELRAAKVGVLIFADVNPVHSWGEKLFKDLTSRVLHKYHFGLYADETSKKCPVFIPVNHYLEHWGDAQMIDGSRAITQPLIAPLNDSQPSLPDALLTLMKVYSPDESPKHETYYEYVRALWQKDVYPGNANGASFNAFWDDALRNGTVSATLQTRTTSWNTSAASVMIQKAEKDKSVPLMGAVLPHVYLRDGKYANLGWLLETPEPITKVTWDNVAVMSQATATRYEISVGDVIEMKSPAGTIEAPAFIQPGMADDVVITTTGFGRTEGGRVLAGARTNAFELLESTDTGYVPLLISKTGANNRIATTQNNNSLSGKEHYEIDRTNIVRDVTLAQFLGDPDLIEKMDTEAYGAEGSLDEPISLVPEHDYSKGHRWAMTIDASACVGCNACVVSCQSENNIPVVGKEQVLKGREMQWLRIDRYYSGAPEEPNVHWQPMLCQHCENAPCENVCPVAATTHSPEGLNEMTYNRCVGTRYCSNNCPYKVRRFNFHNYHTEDRDPAGMVFNPDVTVRMRGVMEKCTFCVQRINEAKYGAKNDGRELVNDGEVKTACQTACPAEAITFGNVNDEESMVSMSRTSDRGYLVLRELNTRPMVTYLAKIRNKNGEIA
jgi:MoCo/4Fe-4S cofactor protein with predicted Tat translocation signal